MTTRCVIFDLDGVLVSTDEYHYQAWKRLADEHGLPFDRKKNEACRGVSRMESLEIVLGDAARTFSLEEKADMASRKNAYYREMLDRHLSPQHILPGAMPLLRELKALGVKVAVGSSSRNTPLILERIRLAGFFDAVVDGNDISRSKPDPEVFLLAASRCGVPPEECLVVEDAEAGIAAALAAGMTALAVGPADGDARAHLSAPDLDALDNPAMLFGITDCAP